MRSAATTTAVVTAQQAGVAKDERSAVDESSRLMGRKVKVIGGSSSLTCSLYAEAACTPPGYSHVLSTTGGPCSCSVLYIQAIQLIAISTLQIPYPMLGLLAQSQVVCVSQAWDPGATAWWSG